MFLSIAGFKEVYIYLFGGGLVYCIAFLRLMYLGDWHMEVID